MTSSWRKLLGHPIVYNYIRPLSVGGIDVSEMYSLLDVQERDVVLDIGCGTGNALNHIRRFKTYDGFDTDPVALEYAKRKFADPQKINFHHQIVRKDDIQKIAPTKILMSGLLHHLNDQEARALLSDCSHPSSVQKIITLDIVFLPGKPINNFFARLDRGDFARTQEEYERLVMGSGSGLKLESRKLIRSHPHFGWVYYWIMELVPTTSGAKI